MMVVLYDVDGTQLKIADRIKNNILPSTIGLVEQLGSDRKGYWEIREE